MIKIFTGILSVIVSLNLLVAIFYAFALVKLITEETHVRNAWINIDRVFKERLHVIPTLLAVFEHHAPAEKKLLREIWDIHAVISKLEVSPEIVNEEGKFSIFEESQAQLTLAVRRLIGLGDRYPGVVKNRDFKVAQVHLDGLENRAATEARFYNQAAVKFNRIAKMFPKNLIARFVNLDRKICFKRELGAEQLFKS